MTATKLKSSDSFCVTSPNTVNESFTWVISNYSISREEAVIKSATFSSTTPDERCIRWQLHLYPLGNGGQFPDCMSVFLVSLNDFEIRAKYTISVVGPRGQVHAKQLNGAHRFAAHSDWGFKDFLRKDLVNEFLIDDRLTLRCEVNIIENSISVMEYNSSDLSLLGDPRGLSGGPPVNVLGDFERLFETGRYADVVVAAKGGQEFMAHKCIMAARSSVFAAMFDHEMREKRQNRVDIADVDADVVREILRYMYTDKVHRIEDIAGELLSAADKYCLDGLKSICEDTLCESLNGANAVDLLLLADMHNLKKLKTHAIDYFATDLTSRWTDTPSFYVMTARKPQLVRDILKGMVIRKFLLPDKNRLFIDTSVQCDNDDPVCEGVQKPDHVEEPAIATIASRKRRKLTSPVICLTMLGTLAVPAMWYAQHIRMVPEVWPYIDGIVSWAATVQQRLL